MSFILFLPVICLFFILVHVYIVLTSKLIIMIVVVCLIRMLYLFLECIYIVGCSLYKHLVWRSCKNKSYTQPLLAMNKNLILLDFLYDNLSLVKIKKTLSYRLFLSFCLILSCFCCFALSPTVVSSDR